MPELVEAELYRRLAAAGALGRPIAEVGVPDPRYPKRGTDPLELHDALAGAEFVAARRRGKLLLLDLSGGEVLGVHFGMSGRLLVDGQAAVDRLLYGPLADDQRYERFVVRFADGGSLAVSDPRRLGGVEIGPGESRLGPDALDASVGDLRRALSGSRAALKARLLDQSRLSGVGNLIADEVLWRAGLAPGQAAGDMPEAAVRRLHRHLAPSIAELIERGGSHTGDLAPERRAGGRCPRDGTPLVKGVVGGRTTWWCPCHQL